MNEAQIFSLHLVTTTPLGYRPDFFASLAEQRERQFQLVVVDHSPQGGELKDVHATALDIVHLRTFRQTGYARGHNQAIAFALQRWPRECWADRLVMITRAEVAFDPRCLEVIAQAFQEDPSLMIAGPKILLAEATAPPDGDWVEMRMTRKIYDIGYDCGKNRVLRFRQANEEDQDVSRPTSEVFGVSEPCVVIRASALELLRDEAEQWLDEALPRGSEIVDLCWRAHKLGLKVAVLPEACLWFSPAEVREQPPARRRVYLSGPVREKNDQSMLEVIHFPWVFWSMVRSAAFLLTHPSRLAERVRIWYAWQRSPSRASRSTVAFGDMRRWFLS